MGSEVLLYGYGIICLSMIAFNFIYGLVMRGNETRLERLGRQFEDAMNEQLRLVSRGEKLDDNHIEFLRRKLVHVGNLRAFDQFLEQFLTNKNSEAIQGYLKQIRPLLLYLATAYQKKENLQAAYFAYFLNRHQLERYIQMDSFQEILLDYMKKESLYCRVNALKALCTFGTPDCILRAVIIQDESGNFLHGKILTECLLTYGGDSDRLIEMLFRQMEKFSVRTQRALLDYIRFKTGNYQKEMFGIMTDPEKNRELRFSAIRYFGRYPYPPARGELLRFLRDSDPQNWEYAAISATVLAGYQGQDVVNALMEAMHSGNWYIRYNASISLEAHGLGYSDLIELVGGRDRYAREMMMYRLENRRLEAAKEAEYALDETEEREITAESGETKWA